MNKLADEIEALLCSRALLWGYRERLQAAVIMGTARELLEGAHVIDPEFLGEILRQLKQLPVEPSDAKAMCV